MSFTASPLTANRSLWLQYLKIVLVVLFYWLISILMVFINKYVFSDKRFALDAPLFITFFQCLCSIAITMLFSLINRLFRPTALQLIDFPEIKLSVHVARKTLPLTVVFVSMIVFNNLCLKYVQVAFYFVSRSLTTVFNVIFVFLILHQRTSTKVILSCLIMIAGFLLGVHQENRDEAEKPNGHLNYFGIFFGLLSSIFVSLNAIYSKKLLANMDNNVWLINLYNNLNSIFIFVPLIILSGELRVLFEYEHYSLRFLNIMLVSGLFGFLIQFSSALQIKLTSPLTHNISGTVKSCLQTGLAVVYYDQAKSLLWWLSNLLVIVGSLLYTRLRQLEMKQNFLKEQQLPSSGKADDVRPLLTNVKTC